MEWLWEHATRWWSGSGAIEHTLLVLAISVALYAIFRLWALRRLEGVAARTNNDVDDRLVAFANQFFGIVLAFVACLVVLDVNDIDVSPLLAGAGIAGIAIGLAAKETLSDVLAGIFLIADRPMRTGDRVKLENLGQDWGHWGDVVDIGLRRTMIRNTDGVIVNYPNSVLAKSVIVNFSRDPAPVRVRVRFVVGHDADLEQVELLTLATVAETPGVIEGSGAVVIRSIWDEDGGHLASGVLVEARYRIEDVRTRTIVRSEFLKRLNLALKAHDVPIAIPRFMAG